MTFILKKKPAISDDMQTIIAKIRALSNRKEWNITYSPDKERTMCEKISADTYTEAYVAFMDSHPATCEIISIEEV